MAKVIAIVQGRIGSRRLPRKTLLELPKGSGVTVVERVFERLRKCRMLSYCVLTTPDEELYSKVVRAPLIWGSLYNKPKRDVLDEFMVAARKFPADHYVRITADCPLIIPEVVDFVVASHLLSGADYTYNHNDIDGDMVGDGQDVEVFTWETLMKTWVCDQSDYGKEHVTPFMKNDNCVLLKRTGPMCEILANMDFKVNKLQPYAWKGKSLNTKQDYRLLCSIYSKYAL